MGVLKTTKLLYFPPEKSFPYSNTVWYSFVICEKVWGFFDFAIGYGNINHLFLK